MPISAPGTCASHARSRAGSRHRGFTLLEILVVVAIIGIFVGVTVLSTDIAGFDRKLEQEADRLGTIVRFVADEALLQSQDFGIFICEDSYHFFVYDYDREDWIPYGVRPFEPRRLEPEMLISLRIEDRDVILEPEADAFVPRIDDGVGEDELDDLPDPQIVVLSSGEITPFQLEFLRRSQRFEPGIVLNVAFNGESEVSRSDL